MAHPVYVLLPDGVEWTPIPDTTAQAAAPVRWYLRQSMPTATTQVGIMVSGDGAELEQTFAAVARRAEELHGIAIDGRTQEPIDTASHPLLG